MQQAMAREGSYRLDVVGHNLVLPRWGGIDSGAVDVKLDGSVASASLERTGDGRYRIKLIDGQTYFQRSTCPSFTRVAGGGREVLTPFVLSDLSDPKPVNPVGVVGNPAGIEARTPELGRIFLELDPATYLPVRLAINTNDVSGSSEWQFSRWGEDVHVDAPQGAIPDGGPGGNPC